MGISVLRSSISSVVNKWTSCKPTDLPLGLRNILTFKILEESNEHVQEAFNFRKEFQNNPVIHLVDVAT